MEFLKGYVDHIIYQNSDNGYAVFELSVDDGELICVGNLKDIEQGLSLSLQGEYVEHAMYGRQFKVASYEVITPDDAQAIERYLGSGAIKGVGPALAKRIVNNFGDDTFRIIEEEPERLVEIKGISERIARQIAEQMVEKRELRQAMMFLQQYGIHGTTAVKIYQNYGMEMYGVLRENPYRLAEDIDGIGFKMADEIASRIGISADSEFRIRSCILYILSIAQTEGHTYLPREILLEKSAQYLELSDEYIEPNLMNLVMDRKLITKQMGEEQQVFLASLYREEQSCALKLKELDVSFVDALPSEENAILQKIEKLEKVENIALDELQRRAVYLAAKSGVMILSGGPGTGKTTTINMILKYMESECMDFCLAAPTGRAAKKMTETTGFEAKTIHRLLELNGEALGRGAHFERNETNPLEVDAVIIDEASMMDIHLFYALLKAIMPGTHLILVGDVDQLPSVGPGRVLRDVMESNSFSVISLKKIFRQAKDSDIVMNAHSINNGQNLSLDNKSKDFFFLERNDVNVIYKHMIMLIQEKLPGYVNAKPTEIQVLTPMKKGNLGAETLNNILQEYLNPPSQDKKEHKVGERLFRQYDKVMQVKNDYQLVWEIVSKYGIPVETGQGVFNGDIGVIKEIYDTSQTVCVEFDDKRQVVYSFAQLDELELAYAITIHKSQGSEYPAVLLPILGGPRPLMNRNLLYTAVTRAKSCVTILGSSQTIQEMIENANQTKRYSGLCERIKEVVV